MRLLTIFAILAALLGGSPVLAQSDPSPVYGKAWFYNSTNKELRLVFTDGRPPMVLPARMSWSTPVPAGVFHFSIQIAGMEDLEARQYFDKDSSFAEVDGQRWVCMIIDIPRGEYYHPQLSRPEQTICRDIMSGD